MIPTLYRVELWAVGECYASVLVAVFTLRVRARQAAVALADLSHKYVVRDRGLNTVDVY